MAIQKEKRDLKKEKIRSPNDAWKGYLKGYSHKTQSFMKNGGQQKCLDEAL